MHLIYDRPIRRWPYALPYAIRSEIQEETQEMNNTRIVIESDSPYVRESDLPIVSSTVVVKKKDEFNRVYVDYRKLNRITVTDPGPMTTAENLFQDLDSANFSQRLI